MASARQPLARESALFVKGENGLGAAFLIDGSRDFYLAHRPDQKLRGSPASFSLGPSTFYLRLSPSARFVLSVVPSFFHRFTGGPPAPPPPLSTPSSPSVRLVPLPVEERSLEGRARRMQKRGKKKPWVEGTGRRRMRRWWRRSTGGRGPRRGRRGRGGRTARRPKPH